MLIFQFLLALLIIPVQFGPLARIGLHHLAAPDLLLLSIWLFAWLGERNISVRWAIILGIIVSLINFQRFGIWLIVYLVMVVGIDYIKRRFFEVSSIIEAIASLILINIFSLLVMSVLSGEYSYVNWLINIIVNAICGSILYFVIAKRFRLFQRWQGGRL